MLIYDHETQDTNQWFVRGTTTAPDFQSFVIPLDSQTGVPLAASGGNAATLFPGNPWTTNFYHYNATNLSTQTGTNGRIVYQNPIVAFGSPAGGSPLYLNQTYDFGFYAGNVSSNYAGALRIQVYNRSNSTLAGTISVPIPNPTDTNQLAAFVNNGFTETTNGFGLTTVLSVANYLRWGLVFNVSYALAHTASSAATNYYYVVECQGYGPTGDYLVRNQSGNRTGQNCTPWNSLPSRPGSPHLLPSHSLTGCPCLRLIRG